MKKRVRNLITMSLVAGTLVLYSCGDNKKEQSEAVSEDMHEMTDHSGHSEEMKSGEMAQVLTAEFSDETVKQGFQQYLSIKDALVSTDAKAAAKAAEKLQATLQDNNAGIAGLASNIAAENDVNKQREIFSKLTAAMDPVLKEAISSGKIYKQYCPMAFEGKGDYWYSASDQIRNPYYGDKMLKCGRIETIIE